MKLVLIAALCVAGGSHVSALHAQTTWTVATGYRAESFHTENIAQFGRELQAATQDGFRLRIAEMLGAVPVDVAMVDVGKAVNEGRLDAMITSAVTGMKNKVWGPIKHYYELNAWFPKNIVFVNAKGFDALSPAARATVPQAAATAETRGWATSQAAAVSATQELQAHGIKLERLSSELNLSIKRMGERFAREWVRSVGTAASDIFVSYYFN